MPGYVPVDSKMHALCGDPQGFTCKHLTAAGEQGDAFALSEIDLMARTYAIGIANVLTFTSVERVSIGGGVANMGELLLSRVRPRVDELAFVSIKGRYDIVRCTFMDDAVLVGSVLYAAEHAV